MLAFVGSKTAFHGRSSCVIVGVLIVGVLASRVAVAADTDHDPGGAERLVTFDLPAQPLVSALENYSIVSGWQVIYDATLATGHRSMAVRGRFTPPVALSMLLEGTGLSPQYMASDGVLLVPELKANTLAREQMPADVSSIPAYYGRIQIGLKRSLCAERPIRSGNYRISFGFWIGAAGNVTRAVPLSSTGQPDVDEAFGRAVQALSVGAAPPPGFAQPVVLLVTPDLVGQCEPTAASGRVP